MPVLLLALLAQDFDPLWRDLGAEDAATAYEAVWTLRAHPDALRNRLIVKADPARVKALIADLANDDLEKRQLADRALWDLGLLAEASIREALAAAKSPEAAGRLRGLVNDMEKPDPRSPPILRRLRAIRALQAAGDKDALAEIARSGRTTLERAAAAERIALAPVTDGPHGLRAFDALCDPSSPRAKLLAAMGRAPHEYTLAFCRQSLADETNGRSPWKKRNGFTENDARNARDRLMNEFFIRRGPVGEEMLDLAAWLIHNDPDIRNQHYGLGLLTRVAGARADAELGRLVEQPHPNGYVLMTAVQHVAARKLNALAPAIERLCNHHRLRVREAARAAAGPLGIANIPPFGPEKALAGALEEQLRLIHSMVRTEIPRDAPFRRFTVEEGKPISGWLLEARADGVRVLNVYAEERVLRAGVKIEDWSLAQETALILETKKGKRGSRAMEMLSRELGVRPGYPVGISARETLVMTWAFARGDRKDAAAILLPRTDEISHDRYILSAAREFIGDVYHGEMLDAFSRRRDYPGAIALARHLSAPAFDGYRYHPRAKKLAAQLQRRADDFVTFKLPAADEWARLKATLSREEQIRHLAPRLRLLNCIQAPKSYLNLAQPQRDTINPYAELKELKLTVADIEVLAESLTDDNFMPTFSWFDENSPIRELHSVNGTVAELINAVAHRELANADAADLKQHALDVAAWGRERRASGAVDVALDTIRTSDDTRRIWDAAWTCARAEDKRFVAALAGRFDAFPMEVARMLREFDLPEAAPHARAWVAHENREAAILSALILLRHGDREKREGVAELKAVLEAHDAPRVTWALIEHRTDEARALALSLLQKPKFEPYNYGAGVLHAMVLAGWPEAAEYVVESLDKDEPWPIKIDGHPSSLADVLAKVMARWREDGWKYDAGASKKNRAKQREELKSWVRDQVELIRKGKPHGIDPEAADLPDW